jgi:hypothetical protein
MSCLCSDRNVVCPSLLSVRESSKKQHQKNCVQFNVAMRIEDFTREKGYKVRAAHGPYGCKCSIVNEHDIWGDL